MPLSTIATLQRRCVAAIDATISSVTRDGQHVAEENRALGGDQFAGLHAVEDLP